MNYALTVLIPCYRVDQWLSDALDSVEVAALGLNVECIIVANNLSEAKIKELEILSGGILDMDMKVVDAGKTDLAGALNFGLSRCSSEIIARMDADDIMMPSRLSMQLRFLNENEEIALVGTFVEAINSSGETLYLQKYPISHEEIVKSLRIGNCFAHPAIMYRLSAIRQVGCYNPTFAQAEDFALYFSVTKKFKVANIPFVGIKYRLNANQVSVKSRPIQEISTRAIILHNALVEVRLEEEFPMPATNEGLNAWLISIRNYSVAKKLSPERQCRKNARHLQKSFAESHIAIARFSGNPGTRSKLKVTLELSKAGLYAPLRTLKFLFALLNTLSRGR